MPLNLTALFKRLLLIFFLYSVTRLMFFLFNYDYFNGDSFLETILYFIYGLRFDACAIAITNCIFITMHFFPLLFFYTKSYQILLKVLFYFVNVTAIIFNSIDFIYFKFTNKRTTADFFKLFSLGEDMGNTIPGIIADFWYILLIVILLFLVTGWMYNKTFNYREKYLKPGWSAWALIVPVIAISVVAWRGGIQYIPVNILSASQYATPRFTPLVLNTPFTLLKTFGKAELTLKKYYAPADLENQFSLHRNYKNSTPFKPKNVVIIILESFSKEYIGILNNNDGFTPFLDSLISQSLVFDNAFANGKKSMEGIPAILAGMPQLMSTPYITSAYNGNSLISLASLLKKKNYNTMFFHGGINGTMGFDRFTKMGGFDQYIGKNEYPNASDFDGNWGIFDEPFFQFVVRKFGQSSQPFLAGIFSLSSHHPYTIPDSLSGRFRKGPLPILESVMYADHSLRRFFETAEKQSWYKNTLFVITADHTGPSYQPFYQGKVGMYAVPLIFFMPGQIKPERSEVTCQHMDVLPSVLDFLHYDLPFNCFGTSVFDTLASHHAVNYIDEIYQVIKENYVLQFDGSEPTGLYHYTTDSTLGVNLLLQKPQITAEHTAILKAFIQQYNNRLISNSLDKQAISQENR